MDNEQNSFDDPLAINQTNTESVTKKKAKFNYTSKFALSLFWFTDSKEFV